jgi:hypothetical protein
MATEEEYEKQKKASAAEPSSSGRERMLRFLERIVPILIPVVGGLWAVILFVDNRVVLAEKEAREQAMQLRVRLVEAQKPFLEHQFSVYRDVTGLIGSLIASRKADVEQWDKAYDTYSRSLTGPMRFVENEEVMEANVRFSVALLTYRNDGNEKTYLAVRQTANDLVIAMKNDLKSSWTTGELGTKK